MKRLKIFFNNINFIKRFCPNLKIKLVFLLLLFSSLAVGKDYLSDYYSSYIFIKNCNQLDSLMYVDNESFKQAKNSIKKIENEFIKKNPNIDTDLEWKKAVQGWKDNYEGTFSMLKSFNTYNEEIAGYCKLQLFLINSIGASNDKKEMKKDF